MSLAICAHYETKKKNICTGYYKYRINSKNMLPSNKYFFFLFVYISKKNKNYEKIS